MSFSSLLVDARKAVAAAIIGVGIIVSSGLLTGTVETVVNTVLAVASAVIVYLIANTAPPNG